MFVFVFDDSVSVPGHHAAINSQCSCSSIPHDTVNLQMHSVLFPSVPVQLDSFPGHCEFSATQCPTNETEAGNSNTNRGCHDTPCLKVFSISFSFCFSFQPLFQYLDTVCN